MMAAEATTPTQAKGSVPDTNREPDTKPTVRPQRVRKPRARMRLIAFGLLVAVLLGVVILAPLIVPHDPNSQEFEAMLPPSAAHLAGTDRLGRDLFSRILIGLRTSVLATLALVAIISLVGSAIGMACSYAGGVIDSLVMRVSDVFLAFPGLVFAMAVAALLDGGLTNAVLALAVISWPKYARIARSQTLALMKSPFIHAARLAQDSPVQLIVRHVLPNAVGPLLVTAMLDIGTMLMELAGLSFLGLGAQPPTAELGTMMSAGRSMLQTYPWVVIGPGIAIFVAVASFNLLGDAVRDVLDPTADAGTPRP